MGAGPSERFIYKSTGCSHSLADSPGWAVFRIAILAIDLFITAPHRQTLLCFFFLLK